MEQDNVQWLRMKEIAKARKEADEETKLVRKDFDKDKLVDNMSKKIKTAFMGAIASFEQYFGELWGHDKLKLTPEQQQMRKVWAETRKEILDKGNDQIRGAKKELEAHTVEKVGYKYTFDVTNIKD